MFHSTTGRNLGKIVSDCLTPSALLWQELVVSLLSILNCMHYLNHTLEYLFGYSYSQGLWRFHIHIMLKYVDLIEFSFWVGCFMLLYVEMLTIYFLRTITFSFPFWLKALLCILAMAFAPDNWGTNIIYFAFALGLILSGVVTIQRIILMKYPGKWTTMLEKWILQ